MPSGLTPRPRALLVDRLLEQLRSVYWTIMQIRISNSDGIPIYRQIVNQVKYLVAAGRLTAGDQLLPVRTLAEQLVVNPNTVSRAYRELESAGVITARQGSGVFVTDNGSPLAMREKRKVLQERVNMLLAEADSLDVDVTTVIKLLRERSRRFKSE